MNADVKFPATGTVHCPGGPTHACDKHAFGLQAIMLVLGTHTVRTPAPEGVRCDNCVNENKEQKS